MTTQIKKLCIILIFIILLEIPMFILWSRMAKSGDSELLTAETVPETTVSTVIPEEVLPTEPAVAETTVPETQPVQTEPPVVFIDQVPQYFQNDYPDEPYLTGTVADYGSSMTALAMVASYMTDHAYFPDEMADMLAHFMGANYRRLEYGNELLQLSCRRAGNIDEAIQAVRNGKTVIVMLKPDNVFTWKEHYVVLIDINDQGRIELMDTDSTHREKDSLQYCFENGFSKGDLLHRYSCAWIYDKASMPEEPFIYVPEPPAEISRYPDLVLSAEEKRMIAKLICTEAGGEPFRGQQAVAEVILNRLKSGRFQNSVYGIIHAENQFASVPKMDEAEPDYTQYKAIEQAQYGPYVLPEDVVFFAKFKVNDNFWGQIGDHYFCYSY